MKARKAPIPRRSFVAAAAAAGIIAAAPQAAIAAPTAAEKQAEADAALASLINMQESLDEASCNYTQALLDQEEAEGKMEDAQKLIEKKTEEIKEYQGKLSTRARSMYRTGGNTFLDVLLGSATFEEFSSNWSILNDMNNQDALLVERTKNARAVVEVSKREYEEQARVAAEKTQEAAIIQQQAQATVAQMQAVYNGLSEEAAELLAQERAAIEAAEAARAAAVVRASAAAGSEYEPSQSTAPANAAATQEDDQAVQAAQPEVASSSSSQQAAPAPEPEPEPAPAPAPEPEPEPEPEPAPAPAPAPEPEPVYEGGGDTVSRAYACLGAPYAWGAVGPGSYDCSGLVSYCLTGSHTRLGTTNTFMGWQQVSNPQPGDVATSWSHCGIYIGNGQMIHASTYGVGVIVGPVQSDMIIVRW